MLALSLLAPCHERALADVVELFLSKVLKNDALHDRTFEVVHIFMILQVVLLVLLEGVE